MARIGRSFPAKAVINRPWPGRYIGAGGLSMSLVLASSGSTVIPPPSVRPRIYCQAVNRAGNFHHTPRSNEWQIWPPRPPMPQSTR